MLLSQPATPTDSRVLTICQSTQMTASPQLGGRSVGQFTAIRERIDLSKISQVQRAERMTQDKSGLAQRVWSLISSEDI